MKYSSALALTLTACASTATARKNDIPHAQSQSQHCFDNLPPTEISLSQPDLSFTFVVCCPGVVTNALSTNDTACLVGDCGVAAGPEGLSTTGTCKDAVPITASDYVSRISSAWVAAGKPSVHPSAMLTGVQTETASLETFTITGAPLTKSLPIDIGGLPPAPTGAGFGAPGLPFGSASPSAISSAEPGITRVSASASTSAAMNSAFSASGGNSSSGGTTTGSMTVSSPGASRTAGNATASGKAGNAAVQGVSGGGAPTMALAAVVLLGAVLL